MASAGRDALTECREMRKHARSYRARADGCGAGAGRVTTTGCALRDDGCAARDDGSPTRDDGSATRDDGSTTRDDGSAACDDGYGSFKKIGRRWVQGWATTGVAQTTTAEIARRRVAGRATTGPTPRGRVASTVYKGGRLV